MKRATIIFLGVMAILGTFVLAQSKKGQKMDTSEKKPAVVTKEEIAKITDAQWKERLTPEQYKILRKAGTERAYSEAYKQFKAQGPGSYFCAGCGLELFSSKTKFDAKCGWPSFYDPAKAKNVKTDTDYHLGYARTEVRCNGCDGHLGHVFSGEGFGTPTDQRYCINGTVLKFVPEADKKEEAAKK